MRFDDFDVNVYNDTSILRVKHRDTGISRQSSEVSQSKVIELMQSIAHQVENPTQEFCSFATALEQVIQNGKGMKMEGDETVIRAQFPDSLSVSDLPYLYAVGEYGRVPWTINSLAPFSAWEVVD